MQLPLAPVAPLTVRTCLYRAAVLISWKSPGSFGLWWSSESPQDFCLLCRSLPRPANPAPVLRRACVALRCVLPPGSSVQGPHRTLSHAFPTSSQGPPADPGTSCIGGGPGCFPGCQAMPSQPSLWNVSGLTGDRPRRASLFDIFLVWLLPDCSGPLPFPGSRCQFLAGAVRSTGRGRW